MNNHNEIDKLLFLYYKGDTTLEEEIYLYKLLIDQPEGTNLTSEQLAFIAMMEYSDDFDSTAWSHADWELADWLDNELEEKKTVEIPNYSYFMRWRGYVAAVIVVLVVVTSTILFNKKTSEPLALRNGQSISKEEASQEVQRSLLLLASCFEHTEEATRKTSETFSDIHRILDKSMISKSKN